MAYVTGRELVEDLPLPPGVSPMTPADAQRIVEDWVGRVGDAGVTEESATSRYIVRTGAGGEVLRRTLRRSGYVETGEAEDDVKRADTMLERLDRYVVGPKEAEPDQLPGYVVEVDVYDQEVPR